MGEKDHYRHRHPLQIDENPDEPSFGLAHLRQWRVVLCLMLAWQQQRLQDQLVWLEQLALPSLLFLLRFLPLSFCFCPSFSLPLSPFCHQGEHKLLLLSWGFLSFWSWIVSEIFENSGFVPISLRPFQHRFLGAAPVLSPPMVLLLASAEGFLLHSQVLR